MKRLVKQCENINTHDKEVVDTNMLDMSNMIELDQLSEADIRHDRCTRCKYNPLKRENGFKICPKCRSVYKMVDGQGYEVIIEK